VGKSRKKNFSFWICLLLAHAKFYLEKLPPRISIFLGVFSFCISEAGQKHNEA
jgi:hypothetical protein